MQLVMSGPDERAREAIKERMKDKPVDHGPLFDHYDANKDFSDSINECYREMRERVRRPAGRDGRNEPHPAGDVRVSRFASKQQRDLLYSLYDGLCAICREQLDYNFQNRSSNSGVGKRSDQVVAICNLYAWIVISKRPAKRSMECHRGKQKPSKS